MLGFAPFVCINNNGCNPNLSYNWFFVPLSINKALNMKKNNGDHFGLGFRINSETNPGFKKMNIRVKEKKVKKFNFIT